MSITYSQLVGGILDYLQYPDPKSVSLGSVLHRLHDKVTYYLSQLNLAPHTNWLLQSTQITTVPNEDVYSINAGQWGRPINVEVVDTSLPRMSRRDIAIVDYQDLDRMSTQGTSLPQGQVVDAVSFHGEFSQPKMTVFPMPTGTVTYKIWYKPTTAPPPILTSNFPLLENFAALIKVDTSLVLLPLCQWEGLTPDQADKFRKGIAEVLQLDLGRYGAQFEEWRRSERQEQVVKKRGYGSDDEPSWVEWA